MAETFVWKNVYQYDRKFRYHMERHPERNWGVILQRACTLYLREKHQDNRNNDFRSQRSPANAGQTGTPGNAKKGKICYKYNGGKCSYGFGCKFLHKCGVCNKLGHGAHICRKASSGKAKFQVNRVKEEGQDEEKQKKRRR